MTENKGWRIEDYGQPEYLDGAQMQYVVRGPSGDYDTRAYVRRPEDAHLFAASADLLGSLRRSEEGWSNAIELGIIPPQHVLSATILRDEARAVIAKATGTDQ